MRSFRIYADADGESHFEDLDVALRPSPGGSELSAPYPASSVVFRRSPAGQVLGWHPAPRRQFVVTLAGEAEVEASDGEVRRIGPGTVMLAEDVTAEDIYQGLSTPVIEGALWLVQEDEAGGGA